MNVVLTNRILLYEFAAFPAVLPWNNVAMSLCGDVMLNMAGRLRTSLSS
jgi:hypothetical protein